MSGNSARRPALRSISRRIEPAAEGFFGRSQSSCDERLAIARRDQRRSATPGEKRRDGFGRGGVEGLAVECFEVRALLGREGFVGMGRDVGAHEVGKALAFGRGEPGLGIVDQGSERRVHGVTIQRVEPRA